MTKVTEEEKMEAVEAEVLEDTTKPTPEDQQVINLDGKPLILVKDLIQLVHIIKGIKVLEEIKDVTVS